jgi:NAD(P)-dependent dehydrogenase (short-subunit alcohol dehydrogenase family)
MARNWFSLEGKVALVTGTSYGLGVIFAKALAEAGADIVATARSVDRLQDTKKLIEGVGRRCLVVECDITHHDQVKGLMKAAWDEYGTVDILVNNAGVSDPRGLRSEHSEPEIFEEIVKTDLIGLWYCCREAAQYMLRQGHGNIINISSIFGAGGFEGRTPGYFAAKGGVNNLTQLLASEWGDRGIRVNALAPHFFDSEMTHDILVASGMMEYLEGRTPMRRIGQAEDLEGPIVFLASDASQFINGVVLALDGGLTASRGFSPGPYPHDLWDPEGRGHPITPETPWPS